MKKLRAVTMCSTFDSDRRYDYSVIDHFGNARFRNKICAGKFCVLEKSFQSLKKRNYQYPQCESICQIRTICFAEQTNSLFLMCNQKIYIVVDTEKSLHDVIGEVF